MPRVNHEVDSTQYRFEDFGLEDSLESLGVDMSIVHLIHNERHWATVMGHNAAIVDIDHSVSAIVEPATLVVERLARFVDLHDEKRFGGIAIITPRFLKEPIAQDTLAPLTRHLSSGGLLLVLEHDGGEPNIDARKHTMETLGLVHRGVIHIKDWIIWHANTRREAHRTSVNIWDSPKASIIASKNFDAMMADYVHSGFRVLDTRALETRLGESTYIPGDLAMLRQGRDVLVQSPCGCTVHHMKGGDWEIVETGCNGGHVGLDEAIHSFESAATVETINSAAKASIPRVLETPPRQQELGAHGDGLCGGMHMQVAVELKTVVHRNKPYRRFQMEEYCTSCGHEPFSSRTHFVDALVGAN